jgi:hypothetical protein
MAILNQKEVGNIVYLNVNGIRTPFYIIHKGLGPNHDSSCDGIWLMTMNYTSMPYNSSGNNYVNSKIHSYLNNTFFNFFDNDIKNVIKQVKLPYRSSGGATVSTFTTKAFILSISEVDAVAYKDTGGAPFYIDDEGGKLRIFYGSNIGFNLSNFDSCWLRSPAKYETGNAYAYISSGFHRDSCRPIPVNNSNSYSIHPVIILPETLAIDDNSNIYINIAPTTPGVPTVPSVIKSTEEFSISWKASHDVNGDLLGYKAEYSIDGGDWTQFYQGQNTYCSCIIPYGSTSVTFRVKAYDNANGESSYATTSIYMVFNGELPAFNGIYINGAIKQLSSEIFANIDGIFKPCNTGYVNIDGVWKEFMQAKTQIGTLEVGSSVWMNWNGNPTEFLVVHHGIPSSFYDSSCDGTWLLSKYATTSTTWGASKYYNSSNVHNYCSTTYINGFDYTTRSIIKQVTVPCYNGDVTTKAFVLDGGELGGANAMWAYTAVPLDYFSILVNPVSTFAAIPEGPIGPDDPNIDYSIKIAYAYEGSEPVSWWIRGCHPFTNYVARVKTDGSDSTTSLTSSCYIRPALILPSETLVDSNFNVMV